MHEEFLPYLLVLKKIPGVGDIRARELLQKFNNPQEVYQALYNKEIKLATSTMKAISSNILQNWLDEAYVEIDNMQKNNIDYLYIGDPAYPNRLKQCEDAPIVLFYKGNITWNAPRSVSIVGTRTATPYGLEFCRELISDLQVLDVQIVSGLAFGIDIQAHLAALDHGLETVACLAHGLHTTSPASHAKYAEEIQENGGFVSEFPTDAIMDKKNFVRRNRIIAGLSQATVVVESPKRGGSLLTADMANSYNREVFALPGRIDNIKSTGCNTLIKTNQARLIQSAADLVYILNWDLDKISKPKATQIPLFVDLNPEEEKLCDILRAKGKESLDILAIEAAMSPQKAAGLLLGLELKGLVRTLPGKQFEIIN
ncbi:MAG TPA: DNA-processing protein DprA [Flavobacteriaceae bacterium]|nr:DNA-processing protein DprA [Flavobacteriaceae bacterium]